MSFNMLRSKFYICPVCGNVVHSLGGVELNCCGAAVKAAEAVDADNAHRPVIENVEDEQFISFDHPMTKQHFISFAAFVSSDRLQMVKLYPEGSAQFRLKLQGKGILYFGCSCHGLMKVKI